MPLANTPDDEPSPARLLPPPQQQRSLIPVSYISSPVPVLASALQSDPSTTAADEANTDFLRSSLQAIDRALAAPAPQSNDPRRPQAYVDPDRDPRLLPHANNLVAAAANDPTRRGRLQRVLSRLNRLHSSPPASSESAYGDRTPLPHQPQNLYDWAPADTETAIEQELAIQSDVDVILRELREQAPETSDATITFLSQTLSRQFTETAAGSESHEARSERRRRERERARTVRGMAVLQRARRESGDSGRSSPSATDRMLRYVIERERSGMSEEEERARGTGWFAQPAMGEGSVTGTGLLPSRASEIRERDRSERIEAFRRGYLAEHVPTRLPRFAAPGVAGTSTAKASPLLENAIKYLSDLRLCSSYEDALSAAIDNGLATKEFFADKHDDFVTGLDQIAQDFPAPSSWLQPGTTFEGQQHASSASVTITHQPPAQHPRFIEQINPHYQHHSQPTPFDPSRPWLSHTIPQAPTSLTLKTSASHPSTDQWPVHVTLHSIDWTTKTLSGTMRAYDVPQHPANFSASASQSSLPKAGHKNAPITTYLEGHILDLATHTFLTPKAQKPHPTLSENATPYTTQPSGPIFPSATPALDAQNWLALPPFSEHPHSSTIDAATNMAHTLLSPTLLRALNSEYIFMRWKERCFIHSRDEFSSCPAPESERSTDRDRGHGLTIGGFYYITLRRSDGKVEGLYFDPGSTPYQLLKLGGVGRGWGSWEFR